MLTCRHTLTVAAMFVVMPMMAPAPPGPAIIYVDDDTSAAGHSTAAR